MKRKQTIVQGVYIKTVVTKRIDRLKFSTKKTQRR